MFRPIRLLILTGLLVAAVTPSVAHAKAQIAISDNKPFMFNDPAWQGLKTKYSRVVVSWNVLTPKTAGTRAEKIRLDEWMAGAKGHGQSVLIALNSSRDAKKGPTEPKTDKQYTSAVKALKKRYPQIKAISPWNEASYTQRSTKEIKKVAGWAKLAKKNCKGCKIVMDVVDKPNLNSWTKKYIATSKKIKGSKISIWGLHNYVDVNNFTAKRTKAFLKITKKGDVWLTETGGVVDRLNGQSHFNGKGIDHQTKATTYLFDQIVKKNPRIKWVFIYNWNNEVTFASGFLSWDSALRDADGSLRPALGVLQANK